MCCRTCPRSFVSDVPPVPSGLCNGTVSSLKAESLEVTYVSLAIELTVSPLKAESLEVTYVSLAIELRY